MFVCCGFGYVCFVVGLRVWFGLCFGLDCLTFVDLLVCLIWCLFGLWLWACGAYVGWCCLSWFLDFALCLLLPV